MWLLACDHQAKKVLKSVKHCIFSRFHILKPVSISLSNTVGCAPSSTVSPAVARTAEVTRMNNKRLYKQMKDLHLGERLSSQTPAEEFG